VRDSFYVSRDGGKITRPEDQREIERAILAAIHPPTPESVTGATA